MLPYTTQPAHEAVSDLPTRFKFLQELGRRCEKRILLKNSANNGHGMGAENIHDDASAKLGEVIGSYYRISILWQDEIEPCLILDQIVDARAILQRPFHIGHETGQRELLRFSGLEHFLY